MPPIKTAAPQFLVGDFSDALAFYVEDPDGGQEEDR